MNMMEFVKLFRKMDTLQSNQDFLYNTLKKIVKNEKKLSRLIFWVGIDLALVWIYNSLTNKEIKDLNERLAALEAKDAYMNATCDCDTDEEFLK